MNINSVGFRMKYQDDKEILDTFLLETRDHLEVIELGILKLENEIDHTSDQLINGLFRAAHSIKAGANLLEYRKIEEVAHAMEDVLHLLRQGTLKLNSNMVTAILQGIDLLDEMINNIKHSKLMKIDTIVKELETLTK